MSLASRALKSFPIYPIGVPGQKWGDAEKKAWLALQAKKRDYFIDVASRASRFNDGVEVIQYGDLDYRKFGSAKFPMFAIRSSEWNPANRMVLVTGASCAVCIHAHLACSH
jgi:hypothetical protein